MNSPAFPLIYVLGEDLINFIVEPETMSRIRASEFISKDMEQNGIVYDNAGNKWTFTTSARKFKNSGFSRFLSKTVYNPMIEIDIHWQHAGNFEMPEIRDIVTGFMKRDKGIMKQLIGENLIYSLVESVPAVADIVEFLKNYQFGVTMQQYANELEYNKYINNLGDRRRF